MKSLKIYNNFEDKLSSVLKKYDVDHIRVIVKDKKMKTKRRKIVNAYITNCYKCGGLSYFIGGKRICKTCGVLHKTKCDNK